MSLNETKVPHFKSGGRPYRKGWRITILVAIYVAVLLLNGLDEFIKSGFDMNFVGTGEWWYKVFRVLVSNLLIFVGTALYLIQKAMYERQDITKRKSKLELIIDNNLDSVTFDPWYLNFERDRKINYYKKELRRRINRLDDKAKMSQIKTWTSQLKNYDENGNVIDEELYEKWLSCKYCQKKNTLYEQLDNDFIEENIDYIQVPYKPNSKSFVTDGYNNPSTKYDDYAVESKGHKLFWDLFPKFALTAGFLIAGESIVVEFGVDQSLAVAGFNMVLKIMPLALQVYMAFGYADSFIDEKIIVDLRKRENIMTKYLAAINVDEGVETNG